MADRTGIEWTDASWAVTYGCDIVSAGCRSCYAMRMAARLERMGVAAYAGLTQPSKAGAVWNGTVREADLGDGPQPLRWRKPRRIFVNSMSDLFHPDVSDDHIAHVFGIMVCARQHTFQVLTKRPERMARLLRKKDFMDRAFVWTGQYSADLPHGYRAWPLPNVWLGASVEDQVRADERIPHLLATPAALRFLSCEPLLGPIVHDMRGIGWVIAGGESGPGWRVMQREWARSLQAQCRVAGVPYFFKQMAGRKPIPTDMICREFPE